MPGNDQLARFAALRRLNPGQRAAVASTARQVSYPAGTQLFGEGDDASGCWLIESGQVALATPVPGRGLVVVQTLGCGDVLGWSWIVPPHHWRFTATATQEVRAALLDTGRLRVLADQDPALGYPLALGLLDALVARLHSTRSRLLDLYGNPRDQ